MVHPIWHDFPQIEKGLIEVRNVMIDSISLPIEDVEEKINQYVKAPGKYIRAGLCLMVAQELEIQFDQHLYQVAASIELFHLATLIHDDVIDQADTRRKIQAIHQSHTNKIAIYAGDYLLALAGRLMGQAKLDQVQDMSQKAFSKTYYRVVEQILVGELRQLKNIFKADMTMMDYLRQIKGKTANLFGLATMSAAAGKDYRQRDLNRLYQAGLMMGMYFQLRDDIIDYLIPSEASGKPHLQDIENGIYTAPYLLLKSKVKDLSTYSPEEIQDLIMKHESWKATMDLSQKYLEKAWKYLDMLDINQDEFKRLFNQLNDRLH